MIDSRAITWLKKNFEIEDEDLKRFRYITNQQLRDAVKNVGMLFWNICEYLEQQETDLDKKAVVIGFENHEQRQKMINDIKSRINNLKIPPVERGM